MSDEYDEEVNHEDDPEPITDEPEVGTIAEDVTPVEPEVVTQTSEEIAEVKSRVEAEATDLNTKIKALTAGLANTGLSPLASHRLIEQRKHMLAYLKVLELRIQSDF